MNHDSGAAKGSLRQYIIGYVFSLFFTLDAYMIVTRRLYSNGRLMEIVAGLAVTQLVVQLIFFLHLGRGSKARWNVLVFGFMLMVVFIVAFGSLWIMQHLNYNMTAHNVNQYLQNQDNL